MLTEDDKAILDLEGQFFKYKGAKEQAARELAGSATRYFQLLNVLIDSPDAEAYAPVTVHRLRRLRDNRQRRRHGLG